MEEGAAQVSTESSENLNAIAVNQDLMEKLPSSTRITGDDVAISKCGPGWDGRRYAGGDSGPGLNVGVAVALNSGTPYRVTTGRDDNHDGLANDRPAGIPRNSLQGPGYLDIDLRASRDLFLSGSKKEKGPALTPALDAFNVLNRVNFSGYVGNLSSPFLANRWPQSIGEIAAYGSSVFLGGIFR